MQIVQLHLYGFGQHEDYILHLQPGINVIYGPNEAGKSTIQQFILHTLFGFPQKNSSLLRYEPKDGGKYGGQIQLLDDQLRSITIERVRGKSAGDVTVYCDGERGDEQMLQQILFHYDRPAMEAIFSFSLFQLQGLEKMNEEELTKTLLSSSTMGVDALFDLEKELEKESGELFKKSGKVPLINTKLNELRALERMLREEKKKQEQYEPIRQRLLAVNEELHQLSHEEAKLKEQKERWLLYRQLQPLFQKKKDLQAQLNEVGVEWFPTDGIRRFEEIKGKLLEAQARKQRIEGELKQIEQSLTAPHSVDTLQSMNNLLSKESEWHQWLMNQQHVQEELQMLRRKQQSIAQRLGIQKEEQIVTIVRANVSIQYEEELQTLLEKLQQVEQQIQLLEEQLHVIEQETSALQEEQQLLEAQMLSEQEQDQLIQWEALQQQYTEAKVFLQIAETKRTGSTLLIVIFVATVGLCMYSIMQQHWGIVVFTLFLSMMLFYFYRKEQHSDLFVKFKDMQKVIEKVEQESETMIELKERAEKVETAQVALTAKRRELLREERERSEQLDAYVYIRQSTDQQLERFLKAYGFQRMPSRNIIPELFRMIRSFQEISSEIETKEHLLHSVTKKIEQRYEEVVTAIDQEVPQESAYEWLRQTYYQQAEVAKKMQLTREKKDELSAQLSELDLLIQSLLEQKIRMFQEASVKSEEAFYEQYERFRRTCQLKEQLETVEQQLNMYDLRGDLLPQNEIARKLGQLADQLGDIHEIRQQLMEEKIEQQHSLDFLTSDMTYEKQLQTFEMKRAEVKERALDWAARQAVVKVIRQMMAELKEQKLPTVLQQASTYFSQLTVQRYQAIQFHNSGIFEAITADGRSFPIVELSQATKEQAYVALRLALASTFATSTPMPILMDDPFVHFDKQRFAQMVHLLDQLKDQHQFIYFTCHEEIKDCWPNATIIEIS